MDLINAMKNNNYTELFPKSINNHSTINIKNNDEIKSIENEFEEKLKKIRKLDVEKISSIIIKPITINELDLLKKERNFLKMNIDYSAIIQINGYSNADVNNGLSNDEIWEGIEKKKKIFSKKQKFIDEKILSSINIEMKKLPDNCNYIQECFQMQLLYKKQKMRESRKNDHPIDMETNKRIYLNEQIRQEDINEKNFFKKKKEKWEKIKIYPNHKI